MFNNVREFPKPLGEYAVGVTELAFVDAKRKGVYEFEEDEPRNIPITVFYPSDNTDGKSACPYTFKEQVKHLKKFTLGSTKVQKIKTHCYQDVPVSSKQDRFPVIFFNHGYFSYPMQNTVLCSDLASKGYIVVSVGHPYEANVLKYPDGSFVQSSDLLLSEFKNTMNADIQKKFKRIKKEQYTDEEIISVVTDFFDYFKSTKVWNNVKIWADDNRFIADMMEKVNEGSISSLLEEKLDLHAGIGITGHSYGGCTASQVCLDDPRFTCGVNIDAPTYGDFWDKDLKKPFMVIGSNIIEYLARTTFLYNSKDAYLITIDKTEHLDFADYIYFARQLKLLKLLGKRDMNLVREVLSNYHISFFDTYLKGNTGVEISDYQYDGVKVRSSIKKTEDLSSIG